MRSRQMLSILVLSLLAACGGGGGGGGSSPIPVGGSTTPPVSSPTPNPTLAPASSRQGDVKTLATGGGAAAIGYWPDYNVVLLALSNGVADAAGGSILASSPDNNRVTAIAYSAATHGIVFSTGASIYAFGRSGPVTTVATNLNNVFSLAVAADGTVYGIDGDHIMKITGGVPSNVTAPGTIGARMGNALPSLAVASDGSLLVSDPTNDVIDHVTASGSITPFAGSCKAATGESGSGGACWRVPVKGTGSSANFGTPGALTYDSATGTLYVADPQSAQLWSVSSNGYAAPVAGYGAAANVDGNGLAAFLNTPTSIAFQPASNSVDILEAAPNSQQEIAAFSATGTSPPAQTPPTMPVYFPNGLAPDDLAASPDGGAWAVDNNTPKSIVRVSASGTVTKYPAPASISPTWHVAVDAAGNAWFLANRLNQTNMPIDMGILNVTPSGAQTYIAAQPQHSGASIEQMNWITIGADGNPWFTESESLWYGGSFGYVNRTTLAVTQYATSAKPNGISQAAGGGIAFETTVNNKQSIQVASLTGQLASAYPIALNGADTMQYRASDSTIWFTDVVRTIAGMDSSGTEHDYAVCNQCDPVNLTVAPDGSVWSDAANMPGGIIRVTPNGAVEQYLLPLSIGSTSGISARPDGKLWVYSAMGELLLFDPAAYDAMNGPHPAMLARKSAGTGMRVRWRSKLEEPPA